MSFTHDVIHYLWVWRGGGGEEETNGYHTLSNAARKAENVTTRYKTTVVYTLSLYLFFN